MLSLTLRDNPFGSKWHSPFHSRPWLKEQAITTAQLLAAMPPGDAGFLRGCCTQGRDMAQLHQPGAGQPGCSLCLQQLSICGLITASPPKRSPSDFTAALFSYRARELFDAAGCPWCCQGQPECSECDRQAECKHKRSH